jgi:protease-4
MPPEEAAKLGLIDKMIFQSEIPSLAGALVGVANATMIDGYEGWDFAPERWGGMPKLALIRIEGTIVEGNSSSGQFGIGGGTGADTIVKGIEDAVADDDVKAIVLRVDSPGGSGSASDLIYRALLKAREKKPVVVSMGNYAASGGYYVAIAGDTIWAEPTTLTGSIGVFALHPDVSGLLHKVSVGTVTLKRGEMADIFQFDHTWSDAERETMQSWVDQFYDGFIGLVAERRKLEKSAVDRIARGRIWSGTDAKQRGLVDQMGSLEDAIADAKARAHMDRDDRVSLQTFGSPKSLFPTSLANAVVGSQVKDALAPLGLLGVSRETVSGLELVQMRGPVAALPYEVDVK